MSEPRKRKVDSECRVFNKEWITKYFFTEVRSTAVCLICQETVGCMSYMPGNCWLYVLYARKLLAVCLICQETVGCMSYMPGKCWLYVLYARKVLAVCLICQETVGYMSYMPGKCWLYVLYARKLLAICHICQETVAVFKEYNISHHFATKHANYASKHSTKEREAMAQRLMAYLQSQQNIFRRQTASQESITKVSFVLGFKLAKASKLFSEGEFLKECMLETVGLLCPENKDKFEKNQFITQDSDSLRRTIDEDIASKLQKRQILLSYVH